MRTMICLLLLTSACALAAGADYIWIEGEKPSSVSEESGVGEKGAVLSGGEWLKVNVQDGAAPVNFAYDVNVPAAGRYKVLVRKFWKHGNFRWRVGGSPWQDYAKGGPLLDSVNVDGNRVVNWVPLGALDLKVGKQKLEVETTGKGPLDIDCFIITRKPFLARGKSKPDEPWAQPEADKWVFDPKPDDFAAGALLDLRHLNEAVAGENGFVQMDKSGNGFADGQGRRLRFWCTTSGYAKDAGSIENAERHARFLAKRGVNLVQILGGYIGNGCYRTPAGEIHEINRSYQKQIWRAVAANKKAGIYTTFSCLGALGFGTNLPDSWKLSPDGSKWLTRGSWFWDPRLREAYKTWLRTFFTEVNPHTGIPLAQDTSIAFIQLMAEDGMLFFTSTSVKGAQRRMLEGIYGEWLKEKHGSLEQALASWDHTRHKDDAPDAGRMGLYDMWQFMGEPKDSTAKRMADQLEFFAKTQRSFYDEMARFCKEELGMQHLTMSGVWRTANDQRMLDMERWTYAGVDVAGKSHFFDSPHQNPPGSERNTAGYQINAGDLVQPRSAVKSPWRLPFMQKRNVGQPFMNHQCLWNPASPWLSESVLIMGAWSALTGLDVIGWFAHSAPEFGTSLGRWSADTPDVFGGFPAAAIAFRRGDVREGRPALIDRRTFAEMRKREAPLISEGTGFDPNQDKVDSSADESRSRTDPRVYLTGPVQVEFKDKPEEDFVDPDLNQLIDHERGVIRSNTGELALDMKQGVGLVNTPRFKAVTGFLNQAGGTFDLEGLTIRSEDEYATVMVVSLDDKPITQARRILVQVTTTARPTGWETVPNRFDYGKGGEKKELVGYEIVQTGEPPWQIARSHVSLTLQNPSLVQAHKLDTNGNAIEEIALDQDKGAATVTLPADTMYAVLMAKD